MAFCGASRVAVVQFADGRFGLLLIEEDHAEMKMNDGELWIDAKGSGKFVPG